MDDYLFNADFSKDYWKFLKIYEKLKSHKIILPNDSILDSIQQDIIYNKESALAFFLAQFIDYKRHLMQQVIINNKNAKYAYSFAANIKGADIQALQNVVLGSKTIKYICWFGCFIKGANKSKIEKLIIAFNNPKYACMWLQNNRSCNIHKMKNIIIKAKRPQPMFLFECAKYLDDEDDIRKIERLIIKSGSLKYIRLFAATIKGANIQKLEKVVLDSENIREIKKFAKIKGSMISSFDLMS